MTQVIIYVFKPSCVTLTTFEMQTDLDVRNIPGWIVLPVLPRPRTPGHEAQGAVPPAGGEPEDCARRHPHPLLAVAVLVHAVLPG